MASLLRLSGLALVVRAANDSNATSVPPETLVGWQAGPSGRGTLALLWSCLLTIFACTYTVLHLDVPALDDEWWQIALRKAKWMAITVVLPELIFAKAIFDLRDALRGLSMFDEHLREKHGGKLICSLGVTHRNELHQACWTVHYGRHTGLLYRILRLPVPDALKEKKSRDSLVEEGQAKVKESQSHVSGATRSQTRQGESRNSSEAGDEIRGDSAETPASERREISPAETDITPESSEGGYQTPLNWTLTHSYFLNMGGLAVARWGEGRKPQHQPLDRHTLVQDEIFDNHPFSGLVLHEKDIADKSKADWVAKGIVILQITWIVLTVVARGAAKLPVTQLEIATLAFSLLALATYAAHWRKPKDVARPQLLSSFCALERPNRKDNLYIAGDAPNAALSLVAVSTVVFGGLHCLAWNFVFPSYAELILWRIASLASAVLPIVALGSLLMEGHFRPKRDSIAGAKRLSDELQPLSLYPEDYRVILENIAQATESDLGHHHFCYETTISYTKSKEICIALQRIRQQYEIQGPAESDAISNRTAEITAFAKNMQAILHLRRTLENKLTSSVLAYELEELLKKWWDLVAKVHDAVRCGSVGCRVWREWEAYLSRLVVRDEEAGRQQTTPRPERTCLDYILEAKTRLYWHTAPYRILTFLDKWAALAVSGLAAALYLCCRIILLILIFTSLRSVPVGVYEDTPWTKFLPSFS